MAEIQDKTREWSERFGSILRLSAETQYPQIYKGAVGGLEHVISADNGGAYMELWRDGSDGYYATTGAAIKPLPGLAKGVRLDEALDRFFVLMAKVEKGGGQRPARAQRGGQRPQRKAIPKKLKRLAGVRKNIVEKVDPEIGPSFSVGHRKPSDLSPESSMRKLAKRIIADITKQVQAPGKPGIPTRSGDISRPAKGYKEKWPGGGQQSVYVPKKPPVQKNVVALTGNQPGSGRVKPARSRMVRQHDTPQSPHREHMRGGRGYGRADALFDLAYEIYDHGNYNPRQVAALMREQAPDASGKEIGQAVRSMLRGEDVQSPTGRMRRDAMEGGRTQPGSRRVKDPMKPAKAPMPPKTYRSREGFGGRRMGDPRAPGASRSGAARGPGRFGKACVCDEVAKTLKAVIR